MLAAIGTVALGVMPGSVIEWATGAGAPAAATVVKAAAAVAGAPH